MRSRCLKQCGWFLTGPKNVLSSPGARLKRNDFFILQLKISISTKNWDRITIRFCRCHQPIRQLNRWNIITLKYGIKLRKK